MYKKKKIIAYKLTAFYVIPLYENIRKLLNLTIWKNEFNILQIEIKIIK